MTEMSNRLHEMEISVDAACVTQAASTETTSQSVIWRTRKIPVHVIQPESKPTSSLAKSWSSKTNTVFGPLGTEVYSLTLGQSESASLGETLFNSGGFVQIWQISFWSGCTAATLTFGATELSDCDLIRSCAAAEAMNFIMKGLGA